MTNILLNIIKYKHLKRLLLMVAMFNVQCSMFNVYAQIVIAGHVYGGGNAGNTGGNTTVTVRAGDLNRVFGGARMANVGGRAFMNIDGAHASNYIVINRLYGGNDIAGTIGTLNDDLPDVIEDHAANNKVDKSWNALVFISSKIITPATYYTAEDQEVIDGNKEVGDIKTPAIVADDNKPIYIGQLFGGGDGEYEYGSRPEGSNTVYFAKEDEVEVATSSTPLALPNLGKTFVDIHGGSIVYAYGGGNNATVTERTVISVDNPSEVVNSITDANNPNANTDGEVLTNDRFEKKMGINTSVSYPSSNAYQIGRLFGGNNKADMAIRPRWNLQQGKVRNLYGGGNEGRMTSPEGLLLEIKGVGMEVDNVFGGCRKADVKPLYDNNDETPVPYNNVKLDDADNPNHIPAGYAARVRVVKGHVNNVYGGNDISGNVYAGNTVSIMTHVYGDVYGGGNGSYAYTDNEKLKDDPKWSDFYYNPDKVLAAAKITGVSDKLKSVTALNLIRPNAEKVSILVRGTEANPTIVDGGLYVGGNSASLRENVAGSSSGNQTHVKIGSHVIIDNVFLGNNGANMIKTDEADSEGRGEGVLRTFKKQLKEIDAEKYAGNTSQFNSMNLLNEDVFAKYMEGCAMKVKSTVVFESTSNGDGFDYEPYSTQFGSFYCGGNVGSMLIDGAITVDFNDKVIIYDKVVGGSNEANVYQSDFNAQYLGGLLGTPDNNGNKLILNFGGLKIQPKRWINENDKSLGLEWNTVDSRTFNPETKKYAPMPSVEEGGATTYDPDKDPYRRFQGGNIYGGCYSNGHIEGNVVINLNASLVDRKKTDGIDANNVLFDEVEEVEGEAKLYDENYKITHRYTGVLLGEQGMDPLGRALNVFGGGYGGDSEIWGSTTINLNAGYTFQIFGGGEQGAIGQADSHKENATDPTIHDLTYEHDEKYSTYINLRDIHNYPGTYRGDTDNSDKVVDHEEMAEAEFIYGGSFEGLIAGSTHINLGNGRIFNSFAGSCNADILGHTETYVGRNSQDDNDLGFPWIRDHIYGGNDLGGRILGSVNFKNRLSTDIDVLDMVYNPKKDDDDNPDPDVLQASAYTEYIQGRVENIFGGCYGDYDYTDPHYSTYTYTRTPVKDNEGNITSYTYSDDGSSESNVGTRKSGFNKPWMDNAFVNFKPNSDPRNAVKKIYGAGQGHAYNHASDDDRDKMQDRSYVLIDNRQDDDIRFINTEVFGAGDYSGLGMRYDEEPTTIGTTTIPALTPSSMIPSNDDGVTASTVIDLIRGHLKDVYGASYKEGLTRRTIVNVPTGSTIVLNRIFGGAYGLDIAKTCDVFESNVNYHSGDAVMLGYWIDEDKDKDGNLMSGGIYGGNNSARRTLYSRINIDVPVVQNKDKGYTTKVFGAGYGKDTWAQYTEVNLNKGASVYEVYGGGFGGMVLNKQSVDASGFNKDLPACYTNSKKTIDEQTIVDNEGYLDGGLNCYLVKTNPLGEKTNTNVYINKGAYVAGYAYGAGMGADASVSGTTYIGLHGGTVNKDVYAAGWGGAVYDKYKVAKDNDATNDFVATTNAFIEGGTARNVYGGGYEGSVGYHDTNTTEITNDILGVSNVVIGIRKDQATLPDDYGFYKGVPAIQRNAYGAGEGGAVYGTANLTINNGYIGYYYDGTDSSTGNDIYKPQLDDNSWSVVSERAGRLKDCGNAFGGGYDDKSLVDYTNIKMWGGIIRSSMYGGGEIATVGRGKTHNIEGLDRGLEAIHKPGKTHIEMYNGHVLRNVYGGGKGYNILGYGGTHELYTDGYVFG